MKLKKSLRGLTISKVDEIKGQKIFITGGAGFIANKLIERLVHENEIIVFDNFVRDTLTSSTVANSANLKIVHGDVLDFNHLKNEMSNSNIIIHAAAIAGIDTVSKDSVRTMTVNMQGTSNALQAAYELGSAARFINFSTSEVFGSNAFKSRESDETVAGSVGEARWTYAVSKLAGEHLAYAYFRQYGLPVVNVRPFNVYGPGQTGEGALSIFIKRAIKDEEIFIDGDGTQIRAWCFVDDFVDGLITCLTSRNAIGESLNLGNARATMTILGLANTVCRVLNSNSLITHRQSLSEDIAIRVPSVEKAEKTIGFKARIDLEEGIKLTANWLNSTLD
jgi:UDP-glucose 4-epimerase